ncbi:uncharacterized protein CXQ87_002635 [Candidozyma duobushaemuli]|uniref:Zn(2)-C6 fungal-type domain-containing protein n=1 Tax=Candidozyma duobushaemuli TaxID=1231522 RepID=A0A2V1AAJ0_9ASCO|nr:uncharacterized protein CXQ87_002635 [[Candida] duobushaemulonis]PVH14494.1 hypothetical protein CXQ87_002635 [[Candida] duobushaemulonis]
MSGESQSKKNSFKRKFHSKSRMGCSTCKRRRVKCDETRPSCKNCVRMKLVCGYTESSDHDHQEPPTKKVSIKKEERHSVSSTATSSTNDQTFSSPETQQATPDKTPPPNFPNAINGVPALAATALGAGLLNAGNLNNINLSHLVNNLSNLGDLSGLGNVANLSSLAVLAQLPIDLSGLGNQLGGNFEGLMGASNGPSGNPLAAAQSASIPLQQTTSNQEKPTATQTSPSISPNVSTPPMPNPMQMAASGAGSLNMLDLKLMYHYTSQVSNTITGAGISDTDIWNHDVPMLAFQYPFLMHAILAFSATHLSKTEKGLDHCVTSHRGDALRLLREAILDINTNNTDALVASALILIMDSLANASVPSSTSPKSLPASAWIFHVKGAATILTAVWPLTEASRFYKFISVDLGDLGDIINEKSQLSSLQSKSFADLECHDNDIADLYPVSIDSPYLVTLAYLNKLHKERYKADFILRIFAFPALLDKDFLGLLMTGDIKAMRIMRSYYKLLRSFTTEMKDKVWFLEGVSQVLPVDVEEYAGGAGGMHMMLDFLGGGPSIIEDHEVDKDLSMIDPEGHIANKLIDTDNLPSDITSNLEIMQGDNGFIGSNDL